MKKNVQWFLKKTLIFICYLFFNTITAQTVTTLAGGVQGYVDGIGTNAQFASPYDVAVDATGNVFVADRINNRIRKISATGVATTFAGSTIGFADGTGTTARFNSPSGIVVDASGNVFVADTGNNRIRKITSAGVVTTLAGSTSGSSNGTGTDAHFNSPYGLDIDANGNVFVADRGNHRIRKITATGVVTTFAGSTLGYADGLGTAAQFRYPNDVTIDLAGNIYVADGGNHRIRKITDSGEVSTFAGSTQGASEGIGTAAQFYSPASVDVDANGTVYVADTLNDRIRKITASGDVSTYAGSTAGFINGVGTAARFFYPNGLVIDSSGVIFVADSNNHSLRKITTSLANNNYILENQVVLYPNPTKSFININFNNLIIEKITLFDSNGRLLNSNNIFNDETTLDINYLDKGIYLIEIVTNKGTISKKIVKL